MFKVQPDIFRRFFFRKQADNSSDRFLPVIFIIIIAVSTSIISLSTFELFDYKVRIENFLSNEWNKIYDLYLGDTDRKDVKDYLAGMKDHNYLDFKTGFRDYPKMLSIKSKSGYIENVLAYAFSDDFKTIMGNIDFDRYKDDDILFLDPALMKKLNVATGDLVLLKVANIGGNYRQALKVKPIVNATRIKCFFLDNYFDYASNCKLRFFFNDMNEMFNFLMQELIDEYHLPTPLNFGYGNNLFGAVCAPNDRPSDFVLPLTYFQQNYGLGFANSLRFLFDNDEVYSQKINTTEPLIIDYDKLIKIIEQPNSQLKSVDLFESQLPEPFFIEIDFQRTFNFQKIRRLETLVKKQESIFDYYKTCDSLAIISINDDFKRNDTYLYMHYTKLDSIILSKEILQELNYKNVRWDTGKWTSIINLNESLKKGQRNTILLIFVNLVIVL